MWIDGARRQYLRCEEYDAVPQALLLTACFYSRVRRHYVIEAMWAFKRHSEPNCCETSQVSACAITRKGYWAYMNLPTGFSIHGFAASTCRGSQTLACPVVSHLLRQFPGSDTETASSCTRATATIERLLLRSAPIAAATRAQRHSQDRKRATHSPRIEKIEKRRKSLANCYCTSNPALQHRYRSIQSSGLKDALPLR